jgi:ATP diphosphatase
LAADQNPWHTLLLIADLSYHHTRIRPNHEGVTVELNRDRQGRTLYSEEKLHGIGQRFQELALVMARLRKECPWDQKQTPDTLKRYILEEAYEVLDAIEPRDWKELKDELGDFTLQVVFQAVIQAENGTFDIEDVLSSIVDKMIRRHPHVFAETDASDAAAVERNWEAIKAAEKNRSTQDSLFADFTPGLPALLEAYKAAKKAGKVGFDWPSPRPVIDKIHEELEEVAQAAETGDPDKLQEELGDLLFAAANLVRKYGFEPEETLRMATRKFVTRFKGMEQLAKEDQIDFASLDLDHQEAYWVRAKKL